MSMNLSLAILVQFWLVMDRQVDRQIHNHSICHASTLSRDKMHLLQEMNERSVIQCTNLWYLQAIYKHLTKTAIS